MSARFQQLASKRGFTLLELLIAMALFAVLSLLGWRGLDTILASRPAVEAPGRAALELAAAWTQLEADLQAARGLRGTTTPGAAGSTTTITAPHIVARPNSLSLLRNPADCPGCWEGVHYAIAANTKLARTTTGTQPAAERALAVLNTIEGNETAQTTQHTLLAGADAMRVSVWRDASDSAGGWATPSGAPATNMTQNTTRSRRAYKVEWRLPAPWDGWVSKVLVVDNRW